MPDMIDTLLMMAGEVSLLMSAMHQGLLTNSELNIPPVGLRGDEVHTAVVRFTGTPLRLVLDECFGWLWYNADGPEEQAHDPA